MLCGPTRWAKARTWRRSIIWRKPTGDTAGSGTGREFLQSAAPGGRAPRRVREGRQARGQVESDARKRAAAKLSHIFWRSRESFSSGLSRFGVRSKLLQTNRLEINLMFQTTRFSRPMLKRSEER